MAESVTERIAGWFGGLVEKHSTPGERVDWDTGIIAGPDGRTAHLIVLTAPSPLLGQFVQTSALMPLAHTLTEEGAEEVVISCLENLRQTQSKALETAGETEFPV